MIEPDRVLRYCSGVPVIRYRGRDVGTADEAARVCGLVSARAGETYQYYVKTQGAPREIGYRHPETGRKLYDLSRVAQWHAQRPGRGARTDIARRKTRKRDEAGRFQRTGSEEER